MNKSTKAFFNEARSILNDETTHKNWKRLLDHLSDPFPTLYDRSDPGKSTPSKRQKELLAEVFPYIEQELDARWPDEVRVVDITHDPHVKKLGRILSISFYGSSQQSYGELFGKRYTTAITKKLVKEMLPHWIEADGHEFQGLILSHVDKFHVHLLEQLLAKNFTHLRYVRFEDISPSFIRKARQYDTSTLTTLTHRLIDLRGDTLESFGATFSSRTYMPELYNPLLERADELPRLDWLCFCHVLYADDVDVFDAFMNHPHYDRVKTLTFPGGLTTARAVVLRDRAASINLERIGVGYFGYYSSRFNLRQLIDAEHLANVSVWDVREDRRDIDDFTSKEALDWRDYKQGIERRDTARPVVDLTGYDRKRTHQALFDEEGNLRAAPKMRALRIQHIEREDLDVIIDHGHEVWPELECLVFQFCPYRDRYERDIAWLQRWNDSPWLAQLEFLDWDESIHHPYRQVLRKLSYSQKSAFVERARELIDVLLAGTWHPFLAHRAWDAMQSTFSRKPDALDIAKKVGIKGVSKLDRHGILSQVGKQLHEELGWEGKTMREGPRFACKDFDKDPLEWKGM